ncbi:MAG TPA: 3-hydroxyacyl-CoA dehydrogenase [Actinomycetota bacterium]|nr:3-hydroxyacyl-CoA dehydrogenase [Actinomycetota bacterium]
MNLQGKTALVTGGASGLGRATVETLHAAGANAVIVDLPHAPGDELVKNLDERAVFSPADVTNTEEVQAGITAAVEHFGGLHIAVNCAGVGWAARTLSKDGPHDLGVFSKVVEVNLIGTFNVIRLAAAQMASQEPAAGDEERGVIVNTASIAAFDGQIGQAAYSASKGGVVGMTLPIARDLARMKIRVCTIAPGTFDTPMLAALPQEHRDALAAAIPNPSRLGDPAEFGALVKHICENSFLNAETIRLDGALRMGPK